MFIFFRESLISLDDLTCAQVFDTDVILIFSNTSSNLRIGCASHEAAVQAVHELYDILIAKGYAEADAEDLQIALDDDELAALDQAAEAGYEWIARDKNGKIFCYNRKPEKTGNEYMDDHTDNPRQMDPEWFSEIKFETGPVNIYYLRLDG